MEFELWMENWPQKIWLILKVHSRDGNMYKKETNKEKSKPRKEHWNKRMNEANYKNERNERSEINKRNETKTNQWTNQANKTSKPNQTNETKERTRTQWWLRRRIAATAPQLYKKKKSLSKRKFFPENHAFSVIFVIAKTFTSHLRPLNRNTFLVRKSLLNRSLSSSLNQHTTGYNFF